RSKIIAFFLIVILFAGLAGMTVTNIIKNINLGLDLQGGFEILYEVEPADTEQELTRDLLESTVQTLNDRVDRLGISEANIDRKSTRLNSSHVSISYAVFCLKKK